MFRIICFTRSEAHLFIVFVQMAEPTTQKLATMITGIVWNVIRKFRI